ncbi:uncharacterized protein LOC141590337 [Silene latifolia]|uniref:uncharacterized protein LOC141590337 n=1 Tax=Silene latifolia TaxID=37657 RepID=UPI003D77E520
MGFPESFTQRVMTCVQTTSFSLCLNGSSFGYFKGKRTLRQGDPISPLIFTMCMEYLTRMIKYATDRWPFQYHPMCKGQCSIYYAVDQSFLLISKASGLKMNNTKLEVYFNGVAQELKSDIQQVTGFVEGSMPFRYLGVPIQAGKFTKKDCNILTEKMVNRIRSLGAKKLSYAGKIDGSSDYHRVPLITWDKVTLPKEEGGLGIKKSETWNVATVAKLVDWIYGKADRL